MMNIEIIITPPKVIIIILLCPDKGSKYHPLASSAGIHLHIYRTDILPESNRHLLGSWLISLLADCLLLVKTESHSNDTYGQQTTDPQTQQSSPRSTNDTEHPNNRTTNDEGPFDWKLIVLL